MKYQPDTFSHPGVSLARMLKEKGLSCKEASVKVNKDLKEILDLESPITFALAKKIEQEIGGPSYKFWLSYQQKYNSIE